MDLHVVFCLYVLHESAFQILIYLEADIIKIYETGTYAIHTLIYLCKCRCICSI